MHTIEILFTEQEYTILKESKGNMSWHDWIMAYPLDEGHINAELPECISTTYHPDNSSRSICRYVLDFIQSEKEVSEDDIENILIYLGSDQEKAKDFIRRLKQMGDIYEPSPGVYKAL